MNSKQKYNIDIKNFHSSEVQDIMGRIPSWIERCGILSIAIVLFTILVGSAFFPYPDMLEGRFMYIPNNEIIKNSPIGVAFMSAQGIGKVKRGQHVKVKLANYPYAEFGYLAGKVVSVSNIQDENGFYEVNVNFPKEMKMSEGFIVPENCQLEGIAEIVVADKKLIDRLGIPIFIK